MFNSPRSDDFGKTLSLLWLFAILNIMFRDIHEMALASTIKEILSGHMNGNPVTDTVLLAAAFGVEIFLLAVLLSTVLAPRFARMFNLVAAPLAIAGMFLVPPKDPDDVFFAVVVIGTFLAIFFLSWTWRSAARADLYQGVHHAT